jgi:succinate dehydrogenase / fumarate reductase iron-sulfur subunit
MYPLDAAGRRGVLRVRQGLGLCNITKCCTEACPPESRSPTMRSSPMKERAAGQRYDPLGRVVRFWRRREGRKPAS